MSWVLVLLFLSLAFGGHSEARQEKKLPSAVVVGTVYCDTCFQEEFSKPSHFIPGASVAVECKDGSSRPIFSKEAKTDKHGEFRIHLPFSVSKHVKKIEGCSVTLIRSSEPYCAVASTANSSKLHLKSRKQGMHIFSAGFFTFKPQKQPDLCSQKPSIPTSKELGANKDQPPLPKSDEPLKTTQSQEKRQGRTDSLLPPLLPPLFPNPFQPPPLIPNPFQPPPLIPNPFQPPPAPLIPNPFQPPPAPLIPNPFQPPPAPLIPNPFQPPPAPAFRFPPIPGLTPSPPPPAPLFPFPPIPGLTPSPPPAPPAPLFPFPPIPGLTPSPPPPPPPAPLFPFPPIPGLTPSTPPTPPPSPPAPLFPFPPIPGLTPSPPPPPPPSPPPPPRLPFPFPPLFPSPPPSPRIPGIPPASSSKQISP